MKLFRVSVLILCCMWLIGIASAATIVNSSFEQPTTSGYTYNPVDPTGGWTFNGRSGVAANTFFNPPPPDGAQAAFLQQYLDQSGNNLSAITQNISGVNSGDVISFFLARRPGYDPDPVVVSYAGNVLGTFTPGSTTFTQFSVSLGLSPASSGVLMFQSAALTTGDLDTALDLVQSHGTATVPEPATMALLGTGLAGLAGSIRRKITKK